MTSVGCRSAWRNRVRRTGLGRSRRAGFLLALTLVAQAFPMALASAQVPRDETVFPTLTSVDPAMAAPGDEVAVVGTGGYVQRADGSRDTSLRSFQLTFDGTRVDDIECVNTGCFASLVVPAGTAAGTHRIATEGGSALTVAVGTAPEQEQPLTPPQALEPQDFSGRPPSLVQTVEDLVGGLGSIVNTRPKLRETDVAYLSGGLDSSKFMFVTSAGTGAQFKLTSWRVDHPLTALKDSHSVTGFDVKLQKPDILGNVLLSAYRRSDGALWLASWKIDQSGTFVLAHIRGYSAGPFIKSFGIASRRLSAKLAEVVTSVVTLDGSTRLVTWHVDENGTIAGKSDSGSVPNGLKVADGTSPVVTLQRGNEYAINFENAAGNITWQYWSVSGTGKPTLLGETGQRRDIRLANPGASSAGEEIAALPLTEAGQTVARLNSSGDLPLQLVTYEHQRQADPLVYGQPSLISDNTADTQAGEGVTTAVPSVTAPRFILTDGLFEAEGEGKGQMLGVVPDTSPASGIGSVTKSMTTHLVLEKVKQGLVDLDDCVPLTQAIFGLGDLNLSFSNTVTRVNKVVDGQPVQPALGDEISLRTLLYMSIMTSDTPATLAAAQYVAARMVAQEFPDDATSYDEFHELVGASYKKGFWVDRMQAEAEAMGLSDTIYCDPMGRCHSTPQDQVTFWMRASLNQDFVDITSKLNFTATDVQAERARCGTSPKPPITLSTFGKSNPPTYPGFEGSKGGAASTNLGVAYDGDQLECPLGAADYNAKVSPAGACINCLVHRDTRLGRTLFTAQQQTPSIGQRTSNSQNLMDYGYRQLFTPDRLSDSGGQGASVGDFALASLDPVLNVSTAIAVDGTLQVCLWDAAENGVTKGQCAGRVYSGMQDGPANVPQTRVDMLDVTSTGAEATYLTGHRTGAGTLRLDLWKVGLRPE